MYPQIFVAGAAVVVAVLAIAVVVPILLRGERARAEAAAGMGALVETAERLATSQSELAGRLQQAQGDTNQRLESLSKRLGDGIMQQTQRTGESLRQLQERLAVIDAAQKNIAELSQQVVGLQDILSNKQARGAFGEIQLNDLVSAILPPSAYAFQATLSNGKVADCLLRLPLPPGPIVIDAKFPLESYRTLTTAPDEDARRNAGRAFAADVLHHVRAIAERYIVPGETAESALMFLPSEAVYAELHANFGEVVDKSYRAKVWIVSPTTLMATLNTVRAVLKDARMREQSAVIQAEVAHLLADVVRLDKRVGNLQRHFGQAEEDLRQIRVSSERINRRGERIEEIEFGGQPDAEAIAPPDAVGEG